MTPAGATPSTGRDPAGVVVSGLEPRVRAWRCRRPPRGASPGPGGRADSGLRQRCSTARNPPRSTRRLVSSRRPAARARASVRWARGVIQTSRPPGARWFAACSTNRSSSAPRVRWPPVRRPIGGLVSTSVGGCGGANAVASACTSSRRTPAAAALRRAAVSARSSMSVPIRRAYGPRRARSSSSAPAPTNGSQTTSSSRAPATRASAAAIVGWDDAGTSATRQAKRGSARPRGYSVPHSRSVRSAIRSSHGAALGSFRRSGRSAAARRATSHTTARRCPPPTNESR